eukprot:gene7368-8188_t
MELASIPNEILSEMCQNILMFLQYEKTEVDLNKILQQLQISNLNVKMTCLQEMVNEICCHYRDALSKRLSAETFLENMRASKLYSEEKITIIADIWEKQKKVSSEEIKEHLNVGQLLDLDWKLSMSMSSSSCKNLHNPSVTLLVKVLQTNGDIVQKSFEMTIEQFQSLSKQLEDTKSVLETT